MNKQENERLAIVETQIEHIRDEQKEHSEALAKVGESIGKLNDAINKLNGRWGLILMVLSSILYIGTFFKSAIIDKFTGE